MKNHEDQTKMEIRDLKAKTTNISKPKNFQLDFILALRFKH